MSATELLVVVAMVVSAEGGTAILDRGFEAGLEEGDQGRAFYELQVNGKPRRIEVGSVEVAAIEQATATVASPSGARLRPGYQVEFEIPRRKPVAPEPAPAVAAVVEDPVPSREEAPAAVEIVGEGLAPSQDALAVETAPGPFEAGEGLALSREATAAEPSDSPRELLHIGTGHYAIGLDLGEAEFFNQTPRHEVLLDGFSIDRDPTEEGLTFSDAQGHCQNLGMRLPTEQEWEVAAQQTDFSIQPGLLEWTASWYGAYPGNERREDAFGEKFRVLRGTSNNSLDPHSRRFMDPSQRNAKVGFRCAKDAG